MLVLLAAPALAQTGLQGNWQGGWTRAGVTLPVTFAFQQVDSTITGSFGSDQLRVVGIPVSKISYRPPAVHFEIAGDFTTTAFDGELEGDSIWGKFKDGNADGQFALRRTSPTAANPYRTEEVSFQNGDVKLAGSLLVPTDGRRKHPVLLFMHPARSIALAGSLVRHRVSRIRPSRNGSRTVQFAQFSGRTRPYSGRSPRGPTLR